MKLKLIRDLKNPSYTLGRLYIDGEHFCFTVEDMVRDINNDGDLDDAGETKVYGETAIPSGTYKVVLSMSNRFKKVLPEIQNVKGFEGIRIHNGNGAIDSHGCIIVGTTREPNGVGLSRQCMTRLMTKLEGQTDITIIIE